MICKNKICSREFTPQYRNGIVISRYCPSCQLSNAYKKKKEFTDSKTGERKKRVKWDEKPLDEMKQYIQDHFCNPYIRERDIVNFGKHNPITEAGKAIENAAHYFSVGSHPGMRFRIDNIHGDSIHSNKYQHGNLIKYRRGLINRHGEDYVNNLENAALQYKRMNYKFDRYNLILIWKTYKYLLKNRIWVWDQKVFEQHKLDLI